MEAHNVSDIKFKEMVIRMLKELRKNYKKLNENYKEFSGNYISMKKKKTQKP